MRGAAVLAYIGDTATWPCARPARRGELAMPLHLADVDQARPGTRKHRYPAMRTRC